MPPRTREEWIREEKRTAGGPQFEQYSTIGELAKKLGRNETTLKRRLKRGAMPGCDALTQAGWQLWSPQTVRALVRAESRQVRPAP